MVWLLFSARACPLITLDCAGETEGAREALAPDALGELEAAALLAEADCVALFCGLLRAALALAARAADGDAALIMV